MDTGIRKRRIKSTSRKILNPPLLVKFFNLSIGHSLRKPRGRFSA
jgi:hypothetical protein